MVQVHAAKHAFERPDPSRIAALSGAMLLNLAGLMLLLIPIVMPSAPPRVEEPGMQIVWPEIQEPLPIQKLPPMPVPPTIPRPRTPVVQQTVVVPHPERPVFTEATLVEQWTPPVTDLVDSEATESQATGPVDVGALATIRSTPPRYPAKAWRAGVEGTVYLRILVGTDGLPLRVEIEKGSGNRELDNEARRHVLKKWVFRPAVRDGVPVQAWGRLPVVFSIVNG